MKTKKVLLLNPPGNEIYIRDYYCSKVSKAYYLPQPVDLLMQSGWFADKGYEVRLLDAIVDRIPFDRALTEAVDFHPDFIVAQCGSVSFENDSKFMAALKEKVPDAKIVTSGDLFLEDPNFYLEKYSWIDGINTNWFGEGSINFLEGNHEESYGMVFRENGQFRKVETPRRKTISIPRPRHELFQGKPYRYPYVTRYPMATMLTNYACPFPCTFCIMSYLPFTYRPPQEVIEELKFLKRMGVKYIYFSDQTFYVVPKPTDEILDFMIRENLGIEWCCFSRVDRLNEERMIKMKKAGCNVVMFGVEWAEDELLKKYRKEYTLDQIRETFALAKKLGLRRMGTFLMGVPGQDEESIRRTVEFAIEIEADYASFNVAVPRSQTSFRDEAIEQGLITSDQKIMDQSGSFIAMGTGVLTQDEVYKLKKHAYRRFYFRPSYIMKRLFDIHTYEEFKTHFREGYYILKGLLK